MVYWRIVLLTCVVQGKGGRWEGGLVWGKLSWPIELCGQTDGGVDGPDLDRTTTTKRVVSYMDSLVRLVGVPVP